MCAVRTAPRTGQKSAENSRSLICGQSGLGLTVCPPEPLWRETGDGHVTTLVATDAGLLVIGIEPVSVKTAVAIRNHATEATAPKPPTPRAGTKQVILIMRLRAPEGANMETIIETTGWQARTVRAAISGALIKKLGMVVTSAKEEGRGRVYRIGSN